MALLNYLYQNIKYPAMARENSITGTVVLEFIVDEKGKVSKPNVLRDIGGGCGQAALKAIKDMPSWTPGRQNARPVKVLMRIPVKFHLE